MGLLLDPTNEDVISILSRLFPGKSVGDVVNSRAADPAKLAVRAILNIPLQKPQAKVTHEAFTERWNTNQCDQALERQIYTVHCYIEFGKMLSECFHFNEWYIVDVCTSLCNLF